MMTHGFDKRQVDFMVISEWVLQGSRVLDLGCGRGILLEHLKKTKQTAGVGVDVDPDKILSCIKRGISAYQGDIEEILSRFEDDYFDWVILSRTVQELNRPEDILGEALRVGKRAVVGFANYDFWVARREVCVAVNADGEEPVPNLLFDKPWYEANPIVPVSIAGFEAFCAKRGTSILRKLLFTEEGGQEAPASEAAYALYEISS